jgi:uncharacterized protein involved in exopolysaccharide biosynthesis
MRIFRNWASWRRLRYVIVTIAAVSPIWFMAISYILLTPKSYSAGVTIVLPGDGPKSSVSLEQVGQATSTASSPWASSRLSPVETYRKLMMTEGVMRAAAEARGVEPEKFPTPKIKLVDQTNFMLISIRGVSPEAATDNAQAFLNAFTNELNRLRQDFADRREGANRSALKQYQDNVALAQKRVLEFQAQSGLASATQYNDTLALVETLSRRLQNVDAEISRRGGEVEALEASLNVSATRAAAALKLRADPVFQSLLEETTAMKIIFDKAKRNFGDRHPEFQTAKRRYLSAALPMLQRGERLTGLDRKAFRALGDLSAHAARETMLSTLVDHAAARDGLLAERIELAAQHKSAQAEVLKMSAPAAELDRLLREHQVAEAVFVSAIARADTTKTDLFAAYPLAQVIEQPYASNKPVSPSTKIGLISAIAGTIFVAGGLILAWVRNSILRWLGRLFSHPSNDINRAMNSTTEPSPPNPVALDDEPLVEIPNQVPYGRREPQSGASRTDADTA